MIKKEMQDILAAHNIPSPAGIIQYYPPYRDLGMPTLSIKNGDVLNAEIPHNFTSPYGFGPIVDGIIQNALHDIGELASRSGLDFNIKLDVTNLPLLASAVDNVKLRF